MHAGTGLGRLKYVPSLVSKVSALQFDLGNFADCLCFRSTAWLSVPGVLAMSTHHMKQSWALNCVECKVSMVYIVALCFMPSVSDAQYVDPYVAKTAPSVAM